MKLKIAIPAVLVSFGTGFLAFRRKSETTFQQEVESLPKITDRYYSEAQLKGLPQPVQRYFRHVLKEGPPYISYARLQHRGFFKTDLEKDWSNNRRTILHNSEPGFYLARKNKPVHGNR